MREYVTVSGDIWDLICYKLYDTGRENMMSTLLTLNDDYADCVIFPAGVTLYVPDEEPSVNENLPPWRR